MKLRTYQGSSMAGALEKVKKDLGPHAVILQTRTLQRGGVMGVGARTVVEITASSDASALPRTERQAIIGPQDGRRKAERPLQDAGTRPIRSSLAEGAAMYRSAGAQAEPRTAEEVSALRGEMAELRAMVRQLLNRRPPTSQEHSADNSSTDGSSIPVGVPKALSDYYSKLIQNAVAVEIAQVIVKQATQRLAQRQRGAGSVDDKAHASLRQFIPAAMLECVEQMLPKAEPIEVNVGDQTKFVVLVGPTGVGKTTTIAKLAAHFKLREQKQVALITTDTYRIGAVDQLKAYAEILNIPLKVVLTPEEMSAAADCLSDYDLVLVDTSGRSQKNAHRLGELQLFLDALRQTVAANAVDSKQMVETHLVLSCTSNASQAAEVAKEFSRIGVDRVVFTKLDEAVGVGVVLNVAHRLDLQLSYFTTGQDVPDDIEVGHARRIAKMVLGADIVAPIGDSCERRSPSLVDHIA